MRELIDTLKALVGPGHWITDPGELLPNVTEWRGRLHGKTPVMLLPRDTAQVSSIMRACSDAGVSIVPQGGNTGNCGGAVPDESGTQVILNLARMNSIRSVDALDFSMIAEAGCVLADLQQAARNAGCLFPLSLGGEGSCQIGGNLSTNAGGINVLRYGTARDLALGLEVVLADGTVWDGIRTLRKNTAGYDLKQLFIGSEGTLGIITAAALKMFPTPGAVCTAFLAVDNAQCATELLARFRATMADRLQAFELISSRALEYVERHIPESRRPFAEPYPWFVLLDLNIEEHDEALEKLLAGALDQGLIADALIAKNAREAEYFWRLRHSISAAEKREGPGIKHDISVPVGRVADYIAAAERRLLARVPDATPVVFGHVGDGNLHYNVHLPATVSQAEWERLAALVSDLLYDLLSEMRGSISAEHGIGVFKRDALARYGDPVELRLMKSLKVALDPENILNPGKVI